MAAMQAPSIITRCIEETDMKTQYNTLPSLSDMKHAAKRLRLEAEETMGHSRSLEILSKTLGYKDWNNCRAALKGELTGCPVEEGQDVSGRYLGKAFNGKVQKCFAVNPAQSYRLHIQLEEAVDVVTSQGFKSERRHIRCIIDRNGRTEETTSNGFPQVILDAWK